MSKVHEHAVSKQRYRITVKQGGHTALALGWISTVPPVAKQ